MDELTQAKTSSQKQGTKRTIENYPHHFREELCKTRPEYRRGKKETAVKVFSIADESFYILIQNVPCLNGVDIDHDLKALCYRFGNITNFEAVEYPRCEPFTQVYLVKYENIVNAIRAKKCLDDYEFMASVLHVCYAPEFESVQDTLEKLNSRQRYVNIKLAQFKNLSSRNSNESRKRPLTPNDFEQNYDKINLFSQTNECQQESQQQPNQVQSDGRISTKQRPKIKHKMV